MKKILMPILLLLSLGACTKDSNSNNATPTNTNGTIRFNNTSKNPYNIYVDQNFQQVLQGGTFKDITVTAGSHSTEVLQISGYLFSPTVETNMVTVPAGGSISVVFP